MERQEIENKVNNLQGNDKAYANNYFIKRSMLDNLFDKVRSHLKRESFGNANAKILFVIDFDSTGDNQLWLIKEIFKLNGYSPYNVYFTPINKTNNKELDKTILNKELEIIQPHRVIVINDQDLDIQAKNKRFYDRQELDRFVNRKELNIPKEESDKMLANFSQVMEYAILGDK